MLKRDSACAVIPPLGWDSFGLPAENAAIARNAHPSEWTYANIETQERSFRRYGLSVDWSRRLHTSDPEYYRWTQWLFPVSYTHLRAHETVLDLVCRILLEKKT